MYRSCVKTRSLLEGLPGASNLTPPAVDEQFGACDVAGIIGGQEPPRLRDLIRRSRPPERGARGCLRDEMLDLLICQLEFGLVSRRYHDTRHDNVDADIATLQIRGPGPSEGSQCGLGRGINAKRRRTFNRGGRAR